MKRRKKRNPRKMAAILIFIGIAALACVGVMAGTRLRKLRAERAAAEEARHTAEMEEESASVSAESLPGEVSVPETVSSGEETAEKEEEEREAEEVRSMLDEQTREANRENAQILKGVRAAAVPNVAEAAGQ